MGLFTRNSITELRQKQEQAKPPEIGRLELSKQKRQTSRDANKKNQGITGKCATPPGESGHMPNTRRKENPDGGKGKAPDSLQVEANPEKLDA